MFIALLDDQSLRPVITDPALRADTFPGISDAEALRMSQQVTRYNTAITNQAAQHGATTVDFYHTTIFTDPATISGDGNHPNGAGYDLITEIWFNAMSPLVLPMPEEVVERYLELRDVVTGEVITVIEILSRTNKLNHDGRRAYEEKRFKVLGSRTHLVEIDLLRAGEPMAMRVQGDGHRGDYRILVSRAYRRPRAAAYVFGLRQPIPAFPVPLRKGEMDVVVSLNTLLHELYDRAGYDLAVDYRLEADPPLEGDDAAWADALLRQHGLRL